MHWTMLYLQFTIVRLYILFFRKKFENMSFLCKIMREDEVTPIVISLDGQYDC